MEDEVEKNCARVQRQVSSKEKRRDSKTPFIRRVLRSTATQSQSCDSVISVYQVSQRKEVHVYSYMPISLNLDIHTEHQMH